MYVSRKILHTKTSSVNRERKAKMIINISKFTKKPSFITYSANREIYDEQISSALYLKTIFKMQKELVPFFLIETLNLIVLFEKLF